MMKLAQPLVCVRGDFPYYCPVKMSHAEYAKCAKTMQSIYPFSIKDFAKTYIASLVCNHPDGKHKR